MTCGGGGGRPKRKRKGLGNRRWQRGEQPGKSGTFDLADGMQLGRISQKDESANGEKRVGVKIATTISWSRKKTK